jgi:predicted transcriptional regulator
MTMMKILEDKGFLRKTMVERTHLYKPAKPREQVVGAMVRDFLDRVFDGAPDRLLVHLARNSTLTDAQRRIVEKLLEEADE